MKRRGFLGFLGGAAVAGPGMAKEIAAKAAAELSVGSGAMLGSGFASTPMSAFGEMAGQMPPSLLQRATSSVNLLRSLTGEQRAELRRRFGEVHRLDADLASYHSMSMGARMEMQRDRNVEAFLRSRKTWWQGVLDRGEEHYANDPLNDL